MKMYKKSRIFVNILIEFWSGMGGGGVVGWLGFNGEEEGVVGGTRGHEGRRSGLKGDVRT